MAKTKNINKKRINLSKVTKLKKILNNSELHTVCESARCPNIGECFSKGTATFLICGNVCTRNCSFCGVKKGKTLSLNSKEPSKIAQIVRDLKLDHVVITSVTRDDLADGGAKHYANTLDEIKKHSPNVRTEILVPDFLGNQISIDTVLASKPDVFAHNLETVPNLYPEVRNGSDYNRSMKVLKYAKQKGFRTKSGLMLGLGETKSQVYKVMEDLRRINCDILTLGQYLSPSKSHYSVKENISDDLFDRYRDIAIQKGFKHCLSGTYVRSSYMADRAYKEYSI
ncbi:lipoyl synthase [Elusimicrobiota bacterium]